MAHSRTPIFTESDIKTRKILSDRASAETLLSGIAEYRPPVNMNFSAARYPYSRLWQQYGIKISGKRLQEMAGFDQSAYTKARRGVRRINASQLIAACLLSKVSVQQAYDIFHLCRDVDELTSYGHEAQVLVWMLDDLHAHNHSYSELIWYTLSLRRRNGLNGLPAMHRRHRRWIAMKRDLDGGITLDEIRERQTL